MTRDEFKNILAKWCQDTNLDYLGLQDLKRDIDFLEHVLYNDYSPTSAGLHLDFRARLSAWVGNLDTETDQQTLLITLKYLLFVSKDNITATYRTAYTKNVIQWLCDLKQPSMFDGTAETVVRECLSETRFTEITGSFNLQEFIRINSLIDGLRYTWLQHAVDWNRNNFRRDVLDFGSQTPKKYLVLFEDFVGSGEQMSEILDFAVSIPDVEILLCPIFICPAGKIVAEQYAATNAHLTYSPVQELSADWLIAPNSTINEPTDFVAIRELITRVHPRIAGGRQDFGAFGFNDTGALVVKHDNCPDNTIPVIHKFTDEEWAPLFFRVPREQP